MSLLGGKSRLVGATLSGRIKSRPQGPFHFGTEKRIGMLRTHSPTRSLDVSGFAGAIRFVLCAVLCGGFFLVGGWATADATAAEQTAEFVEALRQRGWYDTAVDYLDFYEANHAPPTPGAAGDFRPVILYEKARTYAEQAKRSTSGRQRSDLQKQAGQLLLDFATQYPDDARAVDALHEAGNVLAERAPSYGRPVRKTPQLLGRAACPA